MGKRLGWGERVGWRLGSRGGVERWGKKVRLRLGSRAGVEAGGREAIIIEVIEIWKPS